MTEQRKKRRKKRKKTKIEFFLHYIIIRSIVFILMLFPVNCSLKFAAFLGRVLWNRYERGRVRAIENLRCSFPDKDQQWIEATAKRCFEQVLMLTIDILYTPKLINKDNAEKYISFINCDEVISLLREHKGTVLLTGHYGNFEIMGYVLSLFDFDIYSIARPLDNPFLNKYLYGVRQKKGQKIINKKGASNDIGKILEKGASLGFIADQDAGRKGVFINFFGRKASSYKSIALSAMYYNVPIAVAVSRRVGNKFLFEIEVQKIIMPDEWLDKDNPMLWVTQEYNSALEDAIAKDPSQYWWMHRRWKSQPKVRKKK